MPCCTTNCTDKIPARYDLALCEAVYRAYGYRGFIAIDRRISFTDINDSTEWQTHITAGDIIISPGCKAAMDFNEGDSVSLGESGCGENIIDYIEVPYVFETPETSTDYADEDWFYNFHKRHQCYTFVPIRCDYRLLFNDETTEDLVTAAGGILAATDPGWDWSLTKIPQFVPVNGRGKSGKWLFEGYIRTTGVFRHQEIAGLEAVIKAN